MEVYMLYNSRRAHRKKNNVIKVYIKLIDYY